MEPHGLSRNRVKFFVLLPRHSYADDGKSRPMMTT